MSSLLFVGVSILEVENVSSQIAPMLNSLHFLFITQALTQTLRPDSLHTKSMFTLDSDPRSSSTAAEIFQCRRFVTYFRCVFTPGRQCQSICIIYHHLHRSLAVTKYLDCGGICHRRATKTGRLLLQWCLYV